MSNEDSNNSGFDKNQFLSQATSWLLEMELLGNDYMKNALILNLYKLSDYIKDVQVLADQNERKMLVYLKLSGFGMMFKKKQVASQVLDMLQGALPNFQFRVIFDLELFTKAVGMMEKRVGIARKETQKEESSNG